MKISITYPWPDYRLSPNGRTKSHGLIARLTKQVRKKAADLTWDRGLTPAVSAKLDQMIFHPPSARWDDDNARAIGKPVRDGIADALGVDDKSFSPDVPVREPIKGGAIVAIFEIPG